MEISFTCTRCKQEKPGGTGYAVVTKGQYICYSCCADVDRESLRRGEPQTLYLVLDNAKQWRIKNWPGTLDIPVRHYRKGSHNIARTRMDVWFYAEGHNWHGVHYGENSQIVRCKAIKATGA